MVARLLAAIAWVFVVSSAAAQDIASASPPLDAPAVSTSEAAARDAFERGLSHLHAQDWVAAETEYKRALSLNPNYATAHHWYSTFLSEMGRHDEAIAQAGIDALLK